MYFDVLATTSRDLASGKVEDLTEPSSVENNRALLGLAPTSPTIGVIGANVVLFGDADRDGVATTDFRRNPQISLPIAVSDTTPSMNTEVPRRITL